MKKRYVLFDLDGTITDSSKGITNCVKYALDKIGIAEDDPVKLNRFIGPPLDESFMNFYNLSKEDALKAVSFYRERYAEKGIYENYIFDGIKEMLQKLNEFGFIVSLATCKPEIYVSRILDFFEISEFFTFAVGSELEGGKRRHKDDVINEVFNQIANKYYSGSDSLDEIKKSSIILIKITPDKKRPVCRAAPSLVI